MEQEEILQIFPDDLRAAWENITAEYAGKLQEIRFRVNRPAAIWIDGEEFFLSKSGRPVKNPAQGVCYGAAELEKILNQICQYSLYAFSDEIRRGYLTIPGGHRVGLAGQVILEQDGRIKNMKYIRYLNVRIAHEIRGVSDELLGRLYQDGKLMNTLILSPPGCGKTTLLRDLIRNVSDGNVYGAGVNVSVVDERSEIGGSYMGAAQNDLGMRTDLLDACPKIEGMMMLIRSMAPSVLAVDELGSMEEIQALRLASGCGCRLLATIHASDLQEIQSKTYMSAILQEKLFQRQIVLRRKDGKCIVEGIYNGAGEICLE